MPRTKSNDTTAEIDESIVVVEAAQKKRKFAPDDQIECRSVTHGELIYVGRKSGLNYTWADYGDVTYVEYQDLQASYSTKSRFLKDPLFVIEDEELIALWSNMLTPIYTKMVELDFDDLFRCSVKEMKRKLKDAPSGAKKSIMSRASAMILSGELDSISKIKALDEVLGTELILMIE